MKGESGRVRGEMGEGMREESSEGGVVFNKFRYL